MDISKRPREAEHQGGAVSRPTDLVRSAAGRTPLLVRLAFVRLCVVISAAACLILAGELARAESIESFFRGLGRKIKNSIEQKPEHHSSRKTAHKPASSDQPKTASSGPTASAKPGDG